MALRAPLLSNKKWNHHESDKASQGDAEFPTE